MAGFQFTPSTGGLRPAGRCDRSTARTEPAQKYAYNDLIPAGRGERGSDFMTRHALPRLMAIMVALLGAGGTLAQPKGPQPWWPVQPRPLPFVHPLFTDDMVLQRDVRAPIW